MSICDLIILSIALAMDCFAVSFSAGSLQGELRLRHTLILAFFFGFFQAMMPVIGYFGGEVVVKYVSNFDHWIAFIILLFIGGKMIFEAVHPSPDEKKINVMKPRTLIILSIATSIDALAVGFSFSMLAVNIWLAVIIIGIGSFVLSIAGVYMGKTLSQIIKPSYAEIFGGLVLIGIGTKILIEHLSA